jgi:hypothetical protein
MREHDQHRLEPDHGLPLVQLKEQRRELVIALRYRKSPPTAHELMEIASIQHAISALEDVIIDLDAEGETDPPSARVFSFVNRSVAASRFPW